MSESKFKINLAGDIEKEKEEEATQKRLKEKHHIEEENVIVVEKKSLTKYLIKALIAALKTVAIIGILVLATVGLIGIIYPEPREALFGVLNTVLADVKVMIE